ncbi:MAG TPA: triose-phosphate isomerase [Acidimicrobiales bacterium]|jgi:triosephosphate isomerase
MAESARTPLISGNWKMHHTHLEAIATIQKLSYLLNREDYEAVDVSVHPAFTALRSLQTVLDADRIPIYLGAQNCYWETEGAYTGEVSPTMLAKMAVSYVIVGHSERRQIFGETDDDVRKKAAAVLAAAMTPIVCVGETLEQRQAGDTSATCCGQVAGALAGLSAAQVSGLVIAYEPIWAIGTGEVATPEDAQATIAGIRDEVARGHGEAAAEGVRIQYGGSVKPANIAELMAEADIDGALVGGASLDADEFAQIIHYQRV